MYKLIIPQKVQKEIEKIPKKDNLKIFAFLLDIEKNPFFGKKLAGKYKKYWSYRVWPYRIIYKIEQKEEIILVIKIDHRQGIYQTL